MSHEHERPVEPFSDLHVEHGVIRATLLHDPTVEGLDMALYLDGSGSMKEEYENRVVRRGGGLLYQLFGFGEAPTSEVLDNEVEPQARWILEYLAKKDRNAKLRVAYWACGDGRGLEVIGELTGENVKERSFPGPENPGRATVLTPALKDYLAYFRGQQKEGAKRGCAVIITDGEIHDQEHVQRFSADLARDIAAGRLPMINFILVGVGSGVNEEQLEEICHQEYEGVEHLWCHRVAEEIKDVAELVAVLVDETMTVGSGGTIYDDKGRVVKVYEGGLPAVLEFTVPEGTRSFTLEVGGQKFVQPLPEDDDDDDDHGGGH
jgi:hypothetical protein